MTLSEAITACYDPFPPEVIKIRQDAGTGNKALSYVGHPDYTRRLVDHHNHNILGMQEAAVTQGIQPQAHSKLF